MEIYQVVNTIFRSCSYVISGNGVSWLVDCGDIDQIVPLIDERLEGILLTHAHFDHIYGLNHLLTFYPNAKIYTNQSGQDGLLSDKLNFSRYYGDPFVLSRPENVAIVADGEELALFEDIKARAVYTPGHSPGCVTWIVDDAVFTGDSLIPGVKTVTNIPHSDKELAARSECAIREMAQHRTIYPGHAPNEGITL